MMRRIVSLLLILLLLTACAAPAEPPAQVPETPELPAENTEAPPETDETEDHILLTLEAPMADGRTLTLEAFGRMLDEYNCGAREVRVYDGDDLLQTVSVREATDIVWNFGDGTPENGLHDYTNCWEPELCMEAADLNFDGNTDFGLFGWPANNTIPYYYWLWDAKNEQYRYAFTLQGVEAHPEAGEITAEYKSGSAGSQWITEYYRPDENGELYLDRVERDTFDFEPESGYLDYNRGRANEIWVPRPDAEPIRPDDSHWSIESDLVLIRREIPLTEVRDNLASHFTEVWELKDGTFQLTSREEFIYEDQQP